MISFSSVPSAACTARTELSRPTESGSNKPGNKTVFFNGSAGSDRVSEICFAMKSFLSGSMQRDSKKLRFLASHPLNLVCVQKSPGLLTHSRAVLPELLGLYYYEGGLAAVIYREERGFTLRLRHQALEFADAGDGVPVNGRDYTTAADSVGGWALGVDGGDQNALSRRRNTEFRLRMCGCVPDSATAQSVSLRSS